MAAPTETPLMLRGAAGTVEAVLTAPHDEPAALAVVCHPHPLHDGTMHNKVAHTLARTFAANGIAALRFNFRGVGASGGAFDHGDGETEDTLMVIDALRARHGDLPLWLAGFSFGSFVALRAAARRRCRGLVLVAPPVQRFAFDERVPDCPLLVIQGDADEIVAAADVARWVEGVTPRPRFERFEGVGHFFHGRLTDLRKTVDRFIADA